MKKSGGLDSKLKLILVVAIIIFAVAVVFSLIQSPSLSPVSTKSSKINSIAQNSKTTGNSLAKSSPNDVGSTGGVLRGGVYVCNMRALTNNTNYTGCFGDVDFNNIVNPGDRGFIAANIGQTDYNLICRFDLDGNGVINPADRGFVSANIGLCTPLPDYQNGSGANHGIYPDFRFVSPPTNMTNHTICQSNMCVSVQGAGSNLCTTNADCNPPINLNHTICQSNMCVTVQGNGTNQCSTNVDCNSTVINVTANFNVYKWIGGVWQIVNPTTSYLFGEGEQVRFVSTSTGPVAWYSWQFGDQTGAGEPIVIHSFYNMTNVTDGSLMNIPNGTIVTYPVQLTVYENWNNWNRIIKDVRVLGH